MSRPAAPKLVKSSEYDLTGTYLVVDAITGQRLGSVRRDYRGRTCRFQPCIGATPVGPAQNSLRAAADHVALAAARTRHHRPDRNPQ